MKAASSSPLSYFPSNSSTAFRILSVALAVIVALVIMATTGCGSGGSSSPKLSGNTSVTVLLSSTANDELSAFGIGFTGLTLTSQSGKTVTLMSVPQGTQQWAEFIHVNGGADPLVTVSVPQDIYTAAALTVGDSAFTCVTLTPAGGLDTSTFAYGFNPTNAPQTTVTVNLSSPITITGASLGLSLDLQVAQSATYSACYDPNGNYTYSITPTFNLTPITFSAQPTNPRNGKVTALKGEVTALGTTGTTFTLTLPDGSRTLSIKTGSNTAYQGLNNVSALTVGTFVDMDGAVQSDGSLLATRIAVEDTSAVDVQVGPVMVVGGDPLNGETSAWAFNRISQGQDSIPINWPYNIHSAVFQVSGQIENLQMLPFVPSFNAANVVAGQNVYVSSHAFTSSGDPYTVATTVTLMPQTINGTVLASSQSGNFTDYTVSLAPQDLFPELAVQQGQTTLLNNPSEVEVYVDSNTQRLNTQALAPGGTLRFYGLVFNDNGTLRMDCAQVNDGVTASSHSNSNQSMVGHAQTLRREGPGRLQRTITLITRSR